MSCIPIVSPFLKVIALCERNNILVLEWKQNTVVKVKYGPLGYLLRKNLLSEWMSFGFYNSDVHIYPVHSHKEVGYEPNSVNTLDDEILYHYNDVFPLVGEKHSFGLSKCSERTFPQQSPRESIVENNESYLWNPRKWTCLSIAFFCTANKSMSWFYYWQRQRYVWWRKFSAVPSQFSMSDIIQNESRDQQVSLQVNLLGNSQKLETLTLTSNERLRHLCSLMPFMQKTNISDLVCMILCQTDLDFAVIAYLCDAFEEKWQQGKLRTVLRLHHVLAPYKVSVIVDCAEMASGRKLSDVSSRLVKEFKRCAIAVLPNPFVNLSPVDSQFDRFDEIGVPYTVVLNEVSLLTGLAGLRHRDTTLQEQVHITELSSKLLTYLQMRMTTTS